MGTTITVPAELVDDLRIGLYACLADAAEDTSDAAKRRERERHPEWFQSARSKFERTWELLDLIGWAEPGQPEALDLELETYRDALLDALEVLLLVGEDDLDDSAAVDAERAQRGEAPRSEATADRVSALRHFASSVGVGRPGERHDQ
jgi:hypothetical protein